MNVNQKIETALSEMVSGNIWPLSCPLETPPSEYIVYNPELEKAAVFGDDEDLDWVQRMQVHWFKKGTSKKPVNYIKPRSEIREKLKEADLIVTEIETFFENDTGYTHLCFSCSNIEDM